MEIKVHCDCGQKYKFDVEPVHGRMPFAVQCPVCGADGTTRANVILQQHVTPTGVAAAPPPVSVAAPPPGSGSAPPMNLPLPLPPSSAPRVVAASSIPPPPPPPIRVTAVKSAAPAAPPMMSSPPAFAPIDPETGADDDSTEASGRVREITLGWKTYLFVGLAVVAVLAFTFKKWSRRFTALKVFVEFVSDVSKASRGEFGDMEFYTGRTETVFAEDSFNLLVRSTNQPEVAAALSQFWTDKSKEQLDTVTVTNYEGLGETTRFLVYPVRQGGVQVDVDYLPEEGHGQTLVALTRSISEKLGTSAVCEVPDMGGSDKLDNFTTTVVFYEKGEKKFQLDHTVRIRGNNLKEFSKVTGEDWATSLGFKPSTTYAEFSMEDLEKLALRAGYKPAGEEPIKECLALELKPATE